MLSYLKKGKLIIYPTESVFGLGCDPDSKKAVYSLLKIKGRSWKKGLILVAANYNQLTKYIDDSCLSNDQKSCIFSTWPGPMTWLFPVRMDVPYWLTGQHRSLAVRVSSFKIVRELCLFFGKPLVSTSANFSGCSPARTVREVYNKLGRYNIPIINEDVLGLSKPSEIRDAITGKVIRR